MQPQTSGNMAPGSSPEQQSAPSVTPERFPNMPPTPEALAGSPEQSAVAEQLAVDHMGQSMQPVVVPLPVPDPVAPIADNSQGLADTKSTPHVAADTDTIEKEWIDKVQQIISSTRNNPHAQQNEISRLMADYVLKRFGKKVGASEEQVA